jgi:7,8-dihydropterin-6-yl-methyl-4-(beta-D-ribofuranosyl)aminobenzene 5'-phosphate synthase
MPIYRYLSFAYQFYTSHCTGDQIFGMMKDVMGEQLQSFRCGIIIAL